MGDFVKKKKTVSNLSNLPKILKVKIYELNYNVLLTCVNNYLKGYKKTYDDVIDRELSETVKKYDNIEKERQKLLKLIELEELK